MKVTLSIIAGPMAGQEKVFDEPDFFMVGRHEECHYRLADDPYLSRRHFILEINPPDIFLRDLGSTNGTYINGVKHGGRSPEEIPEEAEKRHQEVRLKDKDLLKVGTTEIRVNVEMPVQCVECGSDIPEAKKKAAEFVGGTSLCEECRRREAEKNKPAPPPPPPPPKQPEVKPSPMEIPTLPVVKVQPAPPQPVNIPPQPPPPAAPAKNENLIRDLIKQDPKKAVENPGALIDDLLLKLLIAELGRPPREKEYPSIKGYRIIKQLGAGGFGAVYRAVYEKTGQEVALKTMLETKKPNERNLNLFKREIEVCKGLKHPNIVTLHDAGDFGGIHYFSLELMDAGSVWDLMMNGLKPLTVDEAIPIMLQSLEGLAHAHKKEIIHRDLKPPNILLSRKDGKLIVKVSDFGLAKNFRKAGCTKNKITEAGTFCGSPPYIAPEHITEYRFAKPVTDVFEMAATFYHMLTGRTVWDARQADVVDKILYGSITPINAIKSDIPPKIVAVINKALERETSKRYKDAGEMLKALKHSV